MFSCHSTKQKLIDTALALLWKNSYGAVSVDDICKAAGVKKGSFYHFFPSKVNLATAALDESMLQIKPDYDRIFSPGADPLDRFDAYADYVVVQQEEAAAKYGHVCGCPCTALGSEIGAHEQGIRAKFDELFRKKERYFENALRDLVAEGRLAADTDVKTKAAEIFTYFIGQLTVARIQNDLAGLRKNLKPGLWQMLGIGKDARKVA